MSHTPPEEVIRPRNRRDVIAGLCLAVAILSATNLLARQYLDHFPENRGYWLVREKWLLLERQDRPVDWLILGDSSCNQGVDPERLGGALGGTALNLCTIGDASVINSAWMTARYRRRFQSTPNVLLVQTFDVWPREILAAVLSQIPSASRILSPPEPTGAVPYGRRLRALMYRFAPLYAERDSLRERLLHPAEWFRRRRFTITPKGLMEVDLVQAEGVREAGTRVPEDPAATVFRISDENLRALEQLADDVAGNGGKLVLATAPLYSGLYANPHYTSYFRDLREWVEGFAASRDGVFAISDVATFDASQMEMPDHIAGAEAREAYTDFLAKGVRRLVPATVPQLGSSPPGTPVPDH